MDQQLQCGDMYVEQTIINAAFDENWGLLLQGVGQQSCKDAKTSMSLYRYSLGQVLLVGSKHSKEKARF